MKRPMPSTRVCSLNRRTKSLSARSGRVFFSYPRYASICWVLFLILYLSSFIKRQGGCWSREKVPCDGQAKFSTMRWCWIDEELILVVLYSEELKVGIRRNFDVGGISSLIVWFLENFFYSRAALCDTPFLEGSGCKCRYFWVWTTGRSIHTSVVLRGHTEEM
jgi:hypothetical protein